MSTFDIELRAALSHQIVASLGAEHAQSLQQLKDLLEAPHSFRRSLVLHILERRATLWVHDNVPGATTVGNIDWAAVPWEQIILGVLKVLFMLLPFIL